MDMNISDELLAAYAEGNVTEQERQVVRQYLMANPSELETVAMMMDKDYDLDIDDEDGVGDVHMEKCASSFSDLCYSAAAFAPRIMPLKKLSTTKEPTGISFNRRLGDFLDDILD